MAKRKSPTANITIIAIIASIGVDSVPATANTPAAALVGNAVGEGEGVELNEVTGEESEMALNPVTANPAKFT